MDDIYVYCVSLPPNVHEVVLPCLSGYTIYLDEKDTQERRMKSYQHALKHIQDHDFEKTDVGKIETEAHLYSLKNRISADERVRHEQ